MPPQPFGVEPSEQIAAVLTGWAIAWAMIHCGVPAFPSTITGALVWAFLRGGYRRRWDTLTDGRPDPGY